MYKYLSYIGAAIAGAASLYFFSTVLGLDYFCVYMGEKDWADFLGPVVSLLAVIAALGIAVRGNIEANNRQEREWTRLEGEKVKEKEELKILQDEESNHTILAAMRELIIIKALVQSWLDKIEDKENGIYEPAQLFVTDRPAYKFLITRIHLLDHPTLDVITLNEAILQEKLYGIGFLKTLNPCPVINVVILLTSLVESTTNYVNELADITGLERLT